MNATAIEAWLARLYTDDALRMAFLAQPDRVAREAGLEGATLAAVLAIDREGLVLAARSYASKRAAHAGRRPRRGLVGRMQAWWLLLRRH